MNKVEVEEAEEKRDRDKKKQQIKDRILRISDG